MSRVGVRTLLTYFRTEQPYEVIYTCGNPSIQYRYSRSLRLEIVKNYYILRYYINNCLIQLTQKLQMVSLLYTEFEPLRSVEIDFHRVVHSYNMPESFLAVFLVPVTNIFTMLANIVDVIQKITDNWTKNVLIGGPQIFLIRHW
jgi:hypothetical protein